MHVEEWKQGSVNHRAGGRAAAQRLMQKSRPRGRKGDQAEADTQLA
jgi:hypothetical protein